MRHLYMVAHVRYLLAFLLLTTGLIASSGLYAQQLKITDFALFGGNGACPSGPGQTAPPSPGCAVLIGPGSSVTGGSVGSYTLVTTNSNATISGNIYSGGTVQMSSSNSVSGRITATNGSSLTGNILLVGSKANLGGNIDVNGNISVSGGTVSGKVTHPTGTTYSGPNIGANNIIGTPSLPTLPQMPAINTFPAVGTTNIASTKTITPGSYGNLGLTGGQTLTFSGPGVYVFNSINDLGSNPNTFIFDFKNGPGTFKIYVYGNVALNILNVNLVNGGSASQIYLETHGTASYAFTTSTSSGRNSQWMGTVWAPYSGISVGSSSGNTTVTGSLWSGTQVNVQGSVTVNYAPFLFCSTPNVDAGPDQQISCTPTIQLNGSSTSAGVKFKWTTFNGGTIFSGDTTLTPTVSSAGSYILTVTDPNGGCAASDTANVTVVPCVVFPSYPPPIGNKWPTPLGPELGSLSQNYVPGSTNPAPSIFQIDSINNTVLIEVVAKNGPGIRNTLASLLVNSYGMTDTINNGPNSLIISGKFPIANLHLLDVVPALPMIDFSRPIYPPLKSGSILPLQGDTVMKSNFVRNGYNLGGRNVKVGVISDSYNKLTGVAAQDDIANGFLPGAPNNIDSNFTPVHVLLDYPYGQATDEGRAMLQIVHGIAPKAILDFRTGSVSSGDFAQGILQLQQDGCNVIVDDIGYITEPFLQDGLVAKAVDSVAGKGVHYFSAAGNNGTASYTGTFNPSPAPSGLSGTAHNFGGSIYQNVSLKPGSYLIVLQWQDSIYSLGSTASGTSTDLDIYLTDTAGRTLFGFNRNNIGGDPIEVLPFVVTANTTTNILIVRASGTNNVLFKYVVFQGNLTINNFNSGTSTIVGHANANGAMAVGAVRYTQTPAYGVNPYLLEYFSSYGGTPVNGVLRNKPDFVAPDGVTTTVDFGNDGVLKPPFFHSFFGTSCAAPHAAAVAALLIEGRKKFVNDTLLPAQMRTLLQTTALQNGGAGYNPATGYGLIQADTAMEKFASPVPVVANRSYDTTLKPGIQPIPLTVTGNFFNSNSSVTLRGNPLPTQVVSSTQLTATIPTFSGNPAIQVYNKPISPTASDGGYSPDTVYFFTPVKKTVIVTADNKAKRYGEQLPKFTSTVLVDSVPVHDTALLAQLHLDSLDYTTPATDFSNWGTYFIRPSQHRPFDTSNLADVATLELYKAPIFNDGNLAVNKMPLLITPKDTSLVYGSKIPTIAFTYSYPDSNIAPGFKIAFLDTIQTVHQSNLIDTAYALVNGTQVVQRGQTLNDSDLNQLSIMATTKVVQRGTKIVQRGTAVVQRGTQVVQRSFQVIDSSWAVNVPEQTILNYDTNSSSSILQYGTAMLSASAILNGTAVVQRGTQVVQRTTKVVQRNQSVLSSTNVTDTSNSNLGVLVDSTDLGSDTDTVAAISPLKSMNLLTGITAGINTIVPGAMVSTNFDIKYALGHLTITPAPLTVKALDTSTAYGIMPQYTDSIIGLQYDDSIGNVFSSIPTNSLTNLQNQAVNGTAGAGTYNIVPNATLTNPSNYVLTIVNGILHVNKDTLKASARDTSRVYGSPNPVFAINYSGFVNGDDTSKIVQPVASTTATVASPVGSYTITLTGGTAANYIIKDSIGTLTITKANLSATADNKARVYGDPNPAFTITYAGFLNGDGSSKVTSPPVASTTAIATSAVGSYPITLTGGSAMNYTLVDNSGILTITTAPLTVKADDKIITTDGPLPTFTSTMTGFKNGESNTVIGGPVYTVNPAFKVGVPGTSVIMPANLQLSYPGNYAISYLPGTLYVNYDDGKNVAVSLSCVQTLTNDPSGFPYAANFTYTNYNSSNTYVPVGTNNNLSGGSYSGQLPTTFNPGSGQFKIYFTGTKLTWSLTTYGNDHPVTATASAYSTSTKCKTTSGSSVTAEAINGQVTEDTATSEPPGTNVYPNPTKDWVTLNLGNTSTSQISVMVFDMFGRQFQVPIVQNQSAGTLRIDLTTMVTGMYMIKVIQTDGYKIFRVIKL